MGKRIIYLVVIVFNFLTGQAAHLKGGWIKYEYQGATPGNAASSRYKVTVYQYLSCGSRPEQIDAGVYIATFDGSNNRVDNRYVNRTSTQSPSRSDFPCVSPSPTVCYRIDIYETTYDLPNSTAGYTFAVQRCSRVAGIVNVSNSGNTGVTYTTTIPGVVGTINAYQNTSAAFSLDDAVVVCANNSFTFPFIATDADGDVLVYRFTDGKDVQSCDQNQPQVRQPYTPTYPSVTYTPPFTAAQPLGAGVTINSSTGVISGIAPGTTGDYVVAVMVDEYRNGVRIASNRKEIHITVSGCTIPTADLPIRPTTCDGYTVNFQNGSNSPAIHTYNWDFGVPGSTTDVSTQATPTYTYADTGVYTVTLTVNAAEPCTNTGTQIVRVFPGFFPGFTAAGSCKDAPFVFRDTSQTNYGFIDSWSWNFGDGTTLADTAHRQDASWTYGAIGTFPVRLIATNSKGCIDTAIVNITTTDKPDLRLPFKDTLICSIDTLQLFASSGTGQGSFAWTPNYRISTTSAPNPFVNPLTTTTYTVSLLEGGCIARDTIKVNVLDFITIDAGPDTTICRTDTVVLRPVSQALGYRWSPPATLKNPNSKYPVATPTAASTTYFVQANLGKCQAADAVTITTVPYPVANAGPDTAICFGDKATLHGSMDGFTSVWQPSRLVANPNDLITNATPRSTTTFVLTVTDTLGCPKPYRDSVLVTVLPQPQVFAGNDTVIIIGQPLLLQATASSFLTSYSWTPATGLSSDTALQPTAIITNALFPSSGQITYTFTATSPQGCKASDAVVVKIFTTPPSIFIPNAFTPNGDGSNDIFKPVLAGMQRLDYFKVYNRLGQLVYSTSTIGKGWDGTINGAPQGSAGYVYTVQAIDYNGKVVKQSGSFLLIR